MARDGRDGLLVNGPAGNRVVLSLESEILACGTKDLLADPLGSLVKKISAGAAFGSLIEFYPDGMLANGTPTTPYIAAVRRRSER